MAISTQQLNTVGIFCPVFKSPTPSVPGFMTGFGFRVDVIDVERSVIIKPAVTTLPAKFLHEFKLALPIAWVLVNCCAILVPESLLAFWRTKLSRAFAAALSALSGAAPSGRKVTSLAAIFAGAVLDAIDVHLKRLFAVLAMARNTCFFHGSIIAKCNNISNSRYFDIACKRIEAAYKQPRLFQEPAPKPVQGALL